MTLKVLCCTKQILKGFSPQAFSKCVRRSSGDVEAPRSSFWLLQVLEREATETVVRVPLHGTRS